MAKAKTSGLTTLLAGIPMGKAQAGHDRSTPANLAELRAASQAVPIDGVKPRPHGNTRPAKPANVLGLAESIAGLGQMVPITMDANGHLVVGLNRLWAHRLLFAQPEERERLFGELCELASYSPKDEDLEQLRALPLPEQLHPSIQRGSILAYRAMHIDAQADEDLALACESAENLARAAYTKSEVAGIITRLRALGYEETTGRPRVGQKVLRTQIELIFGVSRMQARRLLDAEKGPAPLSPIEAMRIALKNLRKAMAKFRGKASGVPEGVQGELGGVLEQLSAVDEHLIVIGTVLESHERATDRPEAGGEA